MQQLSNIETLTQEQVCCKSLSHNCGVCVYVHIHLPKTAVRLADQISVRCMLSSSTQDMVDKILTKLSSIVQHGNVKYQWACASFVCGEAATLQRDTKILRQLVKQMCLLAAF